MRGDLVAGLSVAAYLVPQVLAYAAVAGLLPGGSPERHVVLSAVLALLVGVVCVLGWAARLGFVADLLSRPVLVGYLAGIALIMISGQMRNVTGVPVGGDGFTAEIASFATNLARVHPPTVLLAAAVLGFLFAAQRLVPTPTRWLPLNAEAIVELDITAADTLLALHGELALRGIVLALARVKQDLSADLRRAGLIDLIGADRIFPTLPTAVQAYEQARH